MDPCGHLVALQQNSAKSPEQTPINAARRVIGASLATKIVGVLPSTQFGVGSFCSSFLKLIDISKHFGRKDHVNRKDSSGVL
jgi:hypothetical protein